MTAPLRPEKPALGQLGLRAKASEEELLERLVSEAEVVTLPDEEGGGADVEFNRLEVTLLGAPAHGSEERSQRPDEPGHVDTLRLLNSRRVEHDL